MTTIRNSVVLLWVVSIVVICAPSKAHAKGMDVKAGLWEQVKNDEKTAESAVQMPPGMLAALPADSRARVEAVLKRQSEEKMARGNSPAVSTKTTRFCITQKALDDGFKVPEMERGNAAAGMQCSENKLEQSATGMHMKTVCGGQPGHGVKGAPPGKMQATMEFTMTAKSRETYTVDMIQDVVFGDHSQHSQTHGEARWVGADCGSVQGK